MSVEFPPRTGSRFDPRSKPLGLLAVTLAWAVAVLTGIVLMLSYSTAPGLEARPPARWPSASDLPRKQETATMLMFAHPHCPCTKASFHQLERAMARSQQTVQYFVVFTVPDGYAEGWEDGGLFRRAEANENLTVYRDEGGLETRRFASATSGQVLFYDRSGRLAFSGGITASRGHEGDNYGAFSLMELLQGAEPMRERTPVYGCPLLAEQGRQLHGEAKRCCIN